MPKQRSIKQLSTIRQQLQGKDSEIVTKKHTPKDPSSQYTFALSQSTATKDAASLDSQFLKRDLFKILLLSLVCFALQAGLYYALSRNLINLKLFWEEVK